MKTMTNLQQNFLWSERPRKEEQGSPKEGSGEQFLDKFKQGKRLPSLSDLLFIDRTTTVGISDEVEV